MGLFLGSAVAPAILIALLSGVLVGAVVIARKGAGEGRKTAIPFGPFLALGAIVAVFAGQPLVAVLRESLSALKRRRLRADRPLVRAIRPLSS